MISEDNNFVPYKIRPEFIKSKHDCQQFFLCCGIIELCFIQCATSIVDGIENLIPLDQEIEKTLKII